MRKGLRHGDSQEWHANGKPKAVGTLKRGKRVGEWVFWDSNGRPTSVCRYSGGRPGRACRWMRRGTAVPIPPRDTRPGRVAKLIRRAVASGEVDALVALVPDYEEWSQLCPDMKRFAPERRAKFERTMSEAVPRFARDLKETLRECRQTLGGAPSRVGPIEGGRPSERRQDFCADEVHKKQDFSFKLYRGRRSVSVEVDEPVQVYGRGVVLSAYGSSIRCR